MDPSSARGRVSYWEGWLQNKETKFTVYSVSAMQQSSRPRLLAAVSSHGRSDRPKGVRDKPRCGFACLSPAASSPHQAQPLLPPYGKGGAEAVVAAPRASPTGLCHRLNSHATLFDGSLVAL